MIVILDFHLSELYNDFVGVLEVILSHADHCHVSGILSYLPWGRYVWPQQDADIGRRQLNLVVSSNCLISNSKTDQQKNKPLC